MGESGAPDSAQGNLTEGIRFRFVLFVNNYDTRTTVDDTGLSCGRDGRAVAPIPQITSLDPRRPGDARSIPRDCSRQRRNGSLRAGLTLRIHRNQETQGET